jgi:hypothetical protein
VKLKCGPADHGCPVRADEFADAEYVEGFNDGIIDLRQ